MAKKTLKMGKPKNRIKTTTSTVKSPVKTKEVKFGKGKNARKVSVKTCPKGEAMIRAHCRDMNPKSFKNLTPFTKKRWR